MKLSLFKTLALGSGMAAVMSAFLTSGCVVSDGDEPCSSGDLRCTETHMLQQCVDKGWEDYTDCTAIGRTCALVSGLSQCIPPAGSTESSDETTDSNTSDVPPTTDDTLTSASDSEDVLDTTTGDTADTAVDTESVTDTATVTDTDTTTATERDTNPVQCQTQLRVGVLGSMESTASGANISSFVEWLTSHSDAQVTTVTQRSTLDATFLASYDILILLLQSDSASIGWWQYDAAEVAALTAWVNAGGGVIATAGYTPSADKETGAINSLLADVAGLTYDPTSDTFTTCTAAACACWQSAVPVENWDTAHPIARDVTQIGALHGFRIIATGGASIIATDTNGDAAIAAVESGLGRIVAIGDEWPLFANMWQAPIDTDTDTAAEPDTYSPCYDTDNGGMITVANSFQHPQFWYNLINWIAPAGSCMTLQNAGINP